MKFYARVRNLIMFAAMVMFIYQTAQAVIHYKESPTVIVNSEIEFSKEFIPRYEIQ
jgi:hypothetical protein